MAKRLIVGLLVITKVDGMGRVAVLQRRGEFNHEKMASESWPGGCQVTVSGGIEEGESVYRALCRELHEELGFAMPALMRYSRILKELSHTVTEEKEAVIYGVVWPASFLKEIQLGPSSGGLVLLAEDKVEGVQNLLSFGKKEGVTDRRVVAMFPDEKEAVRKAFKKLL